ncbi:MAG: putative selenate ABC transporter substrate-binding protein [Gammaproteobacteria bacterium CG22_combo_CG10-13_8_21_14_all_40_8]|nr:MAG: putative selenate ABC transporter substrate-binding protein [Gammaproteobacteria bacterium CG22_combo_CG10-13_8_21_14_all_40_8]
MKNLAHISKVILLVFMANFTPKAQAVESFVFTAIPDQNEQQLVERFGQVANYLEKNLGVPVKYVPVKSYAAAVLAFRNNQVQLAWFGGLSGVRARLLAPGSQAIAQGLEDKEFVTYFIAHNSQSFPLADKLPETLKGKTFTFGSKGSTSGRLMPEFYLKEQLGQSPDKIFKRVGFSGDHSRTIALVQAGSFDVGAVNYKVWQSELAEGKIDLSKVHVFWKTPTYQDYQWSIRGDVDARFGEGFSEKVKQSLINLKDKKILDAFPREKFIEAKNSDYQAIEKVAKSIGLLDE